MDLPRFILLKSNANNKYLCFTKEKPTNKAALRFRDVNKDNSSDSEKIGFHHIKFEIERAKSVEGLVHIRSCYNNKYLSRENIEKNVMGAEAHEAVEDQSKWNCTLFKPVIPDDAEEEEEEPPLGKSQKIRLLHVCESGERYLGASKTSSDDDNHLVVGEATGDHDLDLTMTNVDATAILPEYITLLGPNDKYLKQMADGLDFLANEVGEERVVQRVTPFTGTIPKATSITVHQTHRVWHYKRDDYYIMVLKEQNYATNFAPIKVNNYIALKCMANNLFANVFVDSAGTNCLFPNGRNLTVSNTLFRVGEPVVLREIIDATFDVKNSRIYNVQSVDKFQDSRSNYGSTEQTGSIGVEYTKSRTSSWKRSVSVSTGIKFTWSAGIPKIGDVGIEIDNSTSENVEWGEEKSDGKSVSYNQGITVPPGKKMTLTVVAMKGYCDVPFTCKVRDTLIDGTPREYTMTDGLFVGCNEYSFDTQIHEQDL